MHVELHEAHGQTMRIRIVFAVIGHAFFYEVFGPWLQRQSVSEARADVEKRRIGDAVGRKTLPSTLTAATTARSGAALSAALSGRGGAGLPRSGWSRRSSSLPSSATSACRLFAGCR